MNDKSNYYDSSLHTTIGSHSSIFTIKDEIERLQKLLEEKLNKENDYKDENWLDRLYKY